eukprot:1348582-Prymnesium_polylepis.1
MAEGDGAWAERAARRAVSGLRSGASAPPVHSLTVSAINGTVNYYYRTRRMAQCPIGTDRH